MEKTKKSKQKFRFNSKILQNLIILASVFIGGVYIGQKNLISFSDLFNPNQSVQKQELPKQLDYSGVEEVYKKLKNDFDGQLDAKKLEDGLKEGLVRAAGDPYTEFLNSESSKDFEEGLSGSFEGIGAELGKDKDSIVVVSPISGFPADKAGLKSKDVIVEINGESATSFSLTQAVEKIRGPKGTKVKLGVIRNGKKLELEITRAQITIPSVKSEVNAQNIGVITINRFGEDTVDLCNKAAKDFKSKNVKGVVLDLRGNPGGLLDAAVGVSNVWLNKNNIILQEKRDNKVIKTYFAKGDPILGGVPTVVLIDEGSASASEIVAGALKDNKAATIMGEKSYGKGSVQQVSELDNGGLLKVTVARWFTPGGRNIDKEGIEPDKKFAISDKDIAAKRDPQKDAAIELLNH